MAFNVKAPVSNPVAEVGIREIQTQLPTPFPMNLGRPANISANPLMEVLNPVGEYLKQQASNQIEPEVNTFLQQVMELAQQRFPNLGGTNLQGIGSLMQVPRIPTTFSPVNISQFNEPTGRPSRLETFDGPVYALNQLGRKPL